MTTFHSLVSKKLDEIEAEMKRIDYWQKSPPDLLAKIARGEFRSYLDAPSFEIWLQTVFLPNARQAVIADTLPTESNVGVMALRQYDYHSSIPEAHGLMKLLGEFDVLIRSNTS